MSKTITTQQITNSQYRNATGALSVTLRNDMMLHYTMQKSKKALKGLVCALKGFDPETVYDVCLMNPIDYGSFGGKEIILDVKVTFNNSNIMDIELQMYYDAYWEQRSVLYLCRTYDTLDSGEDYKQLKPATFVAIVPKPLFPDHPEFYSKFLLLNEKYHYPYTSNFRLNVLDLSQTGLATEEDRSSGLLHWAQMFLANSWEELKQIAAGDPAFEEVLDNMYTVNTIPEERTIFEAHQKYQALMSALKSDKEEYAAELAKKNIELAKKDTELTKKDTELAKKDLNSKNCVNL